MKPLILGHRGFSKEYPENSLLAFEKAYENGADGIELDVRKTKDGHVVVIHDDTLERVLPPDHEYTESEAKKNICDMTLEELRNYKLPMDQKVPLLKEVLEISPKGKMINIEIKEMEVVDPLYDMLRSCDEYEDILFSSFLYDAIKRIDELLPKVKKALLVGENAQKADNPVNFIAGIASEYKPYSLNLPVQAFEIMPYDFCIPLFKNLKNQSDIKYMWWTLDDSELAKKLAQDGILDYIITNDVVLMRKIFD